SAADTSSRLPGGCACLPKQHDPTMEEQATVSGGSKPWRRPKWPSPITRPQTLHVYASSGIFFFQGRIARSAGVVNEYDPDCEARNSNQFCYRTPGAMEFFSNSQ